MSPKGHPELAGKGIEFSWGVSKKHFRKINNCVGKDLHNSTLKSFTVIDLAQSMEIAAALADAGTHVTRAEKHTKHATATFPQKNACHFGGIFWSPRKCHRNILDQETSFIKSVLAKHNM
jgi:hypothetical protein